MEGGGHLSVWSRWWLDALTTLNILLGNGLDPSIGITLCMYSLMIR